MVCFRRAMNLKDNHLKVMLRDDLLWYKSSLPLRLRGCSLFD